MSLKESYWNSKGRHEGLISQLQLLIPKEGPCNAGAPALENLRRAINAYYDQYNNGGCNYPKRIRRTFGVMPGDFSDKAAAIVEHVMDGLILAAAKEQGIKRRKPAKRGAA